MDVSEYVDGSKPVKSIVESFSKIKQQVYIGYFNAESSGQNFSPTPYYLVN